MDKELIVEPIIVGLLQTNCYILAEAKSRQAFVIDPGDEANRIKAALDRLNLTLNSLILTHGHFDHIGAIEAFGVPVYVHADEVKYLKNNMMSIEENLDIEKKFDLELKILQDNDKITLGDLEILVMHTPGHTAGGICLKVGDILFSGDTLFHRGIGRTDSPGGSYDKIKESIQEKIFRLDEDTLVLPGHGLATTVGEEKKENSFV